MRSSQSTASRAQVSSLRTLRCNSGAQAYTQTSHPARARAHTHTRACSLMKRSATQTQTQASCPRLLAVRLFLELCARARTHTEHISQDNFTNGILVQFRCPRLYSHQCPYKVKVVHSGVSQSSRIWTSGLHMHGSEREHHNVTFPADVRQQIHDYIKQGYRA